MVDAVLQLVPAWQYAMDGESLCYGGYGSQIPLAGAALAALPGMLFAHLPTWARASPRTPALDTDVGAWFLSGYATCRHACAHSGRVPQSLHREVFRTDPARLSHCGGKRDHELCERPHCDSVRHCGAVGCGSVLWSATV